MAYHDEIKRVFTDKYDPSKMAETLPNGAGSIDDVVADFISKMNSALESSVGSKTVSKKFSRPWFDDELKEAIVKRRAARSRFISARSLDNWKKFCSLRSSCRRLVRIKKRIHWESLVKSIGENSGTNPKRMWSLIHWR